MVEVEDGEFDVSEMIIECLAVEEGLTDVELAQLDQELDPEAVLTLKSLCLADNNL